MNATLTTAAPATSGQRVPHRAVTGVVCVALAAVVAAHVVAQRRASRRRPLHPGRSTEITWIIDAYSLCFAALLLPAGAIGDRFGRRLTLLIGLVIFGVGSAVAMTADGATS